MDGIAQHEKFCSLKVDVVEVDVGIIHQILLGFFRMVYVLVPIDEIHMLQRNLVYNDGHGCCFRLLLVALEHLGKESEIELVFPLILYQIGLGVAQFHVIQMDFPFQQVADVDFGPQLFYLCQIILSQVFNNDIIDIDAEIRRDGQTPHFNVGAGFFRKVAACKTHCKLLNDRVLDGNKNTCDDSQHHHKKHQNAMDNLFFNTFDPPN